MPKEMLRTEQFYIQMDELKHTLEIGFTGEANEPLRSLNLSHAELTQLLYTLLDVSSVFRGDTAYFEPKSGQESDV
ncbi:hypothetical protein [Paenibacillus whitsoniae]|uniref:Uncharacterized protein n=1 Tax=Paenibacillus whitsoniae TaxID=2496558 RepID=A0A3S0BNA9_9BACL|nr:hypothetical protein [Paenibacillus whitsoniae]RTE10362.1 hypothetical protein EJQ19_07635 [Paenibacillus whitsoniae]